MTTQTDIMDAMEGRGWMRPMEIAAALGACVGAIASQINAMERKGAIKRRGEPRKWQFCLVRRVHVFTRQDTSKSGVNDRLGWPRTSNMPDDEITALYDDATYNGVRYYDPEADAKASHIAALKAAAGKAA